MFKSVVDRVSDVHAFSGTPDECSNIHVSWFGEPNDIVSIVDLPLETRGQFPGRGPLSMKRNHPGHLNRLVQSAGLPRSSRRTDRYTNHVKYFFTIEETAKLAELNQLDLMEMVESGKVKPSPLLDLLMAGAPVDLIMPRGSIVDRPDPPPLFTRQKVREIQALKAPKWDKASPQPPKTSKAWNPKADPNLIYTPAELAQAWEVSVATIRRLFESEDDVLKHGEENPKRKRRYVTLRIPQAVALRVYRRLSS